LETKNIDLEAKLNNGLRQAVKKERDIARQCYNGRFTRPLNIKDVFSNEIVYLLHKRIVWKIYFHNVPRVGS